MAIGHWFDKCSNWKFKQKKTYRTLTTYLHKTDRTVRYVMLTFFFEMYAKNFEEDDDHTHVGDDGDGA